MDEKELEQQLGESARALRTGKFSARWKRIKRRLFRERSAAVKRTAAVASALCGAVAVLSLALGFGLRMPQAVRQVQIQEYYADTELTNVAVSKDEFYGTMETAGFSVLDFSQFDDYDRYYLAVARGETVLGGRVDFNNVRGEAEYIYSISFYSPQVVLKQFNYQNLTQEMTVGGMTVRYETNAADGYESKALLTCRNVTYLISYVSLNDDLQIFLGRIFA